MSVPATSALSAAMRRVGAACVRLPESRRPDVIGSGWREREAAIDAAIAARDHEAFRRAVEEWERFALGTFRGAAAE